MIVYAYSLDQLMNPLVEAINGLRDQNNNLVWGRDDKASVAYFPGRNLVSSSGHIHNYVLNGSKFASYLRQARENGTLTAVRDYVDPLAARMLMKYGPYFLTHTRWISMDIFDVGTLADIVGRRDIRSLARHLPLEVQALHALNPPVPKKREFEVWQHYCDSDCDMIKPSSPLLFEVVKAAASL